MTAWIMVNSNGMPFNINMYALYDGYTQIGEEVKTYTVKDLFEDTIPADKDNIVTGHIDQCRRYVKKITGKEPKNLDYPNELLPFMKRKFWKSTLSEIYNQYSGNELPNPLFVKSVDQKKITGFVCNNFNDFVTNCSGHDKSTEVYVSEVLNFVSEFRTYIHRHDIVGSFRYKGDWAISPNRKIVENMLYELRNAYMPIAYSIDVGITDTNETVLIECNDGFALGNYGLNTRVYAEMNRDRWYQMVTEK